MELTRATQYALKAVAYLAGKPDGLAVPSQEIAQVTGTPERFLVKILRPLVRAGMLAALQGPHGGYRLARPAQEITVLEVIEAVGGPVRGEVPDLRVQGGAAADTRLVVLCEEVAEGARAALQKVTVADLVGGGGGGKRKGK